MVAAKDDEIYSVYAEVDLNRPRKKLSLGQC